jgi:hypothetical protein
LSPPCSKICTSGSFHSPRYLSSSCLLLAHSVLWES